MIKIVKYIIFEGSASEYPFIFPQWKLHSIAANNNRDKVVSAGFAEYDEEDRYYECFGESESLNIGSRPQDTDILNAGRG